MPTVVKVIRRRQKVRLYSANQMKYKSRQDRAEADQPMGGGAGRDGRLAELMKLARQAPE
jgi:ribosomal protein L36